MPQTREHFDICRLLGVKRGVVALTKSDVVDSETLELVRMEAEEFLRGSFLETAPLVHVSAKTGAGLGELKRALSDAAANAAAKDAARYFRLPSDRAFAMKGFGSVVTGTLGEVLCYGEKERPRGGSAIANLKLQDEVLVVPGDRFIVRQFSPVVTIGGGAVLDPLARRPMLRDTGRSAFLETLEGGSNEEILAAMTARALLGLGYEEIVARTGWMEKEIQEALEKLHGTGHVRIVSTEPLVLVSGKLVAEERKKLSNKVERFQKENPLLPGIPREDLRASLGKSGRSGTFRAALEELAAQKKLDAQGEWVKKA